MRAHHVIVSIAIVCLTACGQTNDASGVVAPPRPSFAQGTVQPGGTCPSHQFDRFLAAFVSSAEIQKSFTASPLQSDSIDAGAEPEPTTVRRQLLPSKLGFPIMQTAQQQRDEGLTMSRRRNGKDMVVTVSKPDTDYQVSYYFRQTEGCWRLYRKFDESI